MILIKVYFISFAYFRGSRDAEYEENEGVAEEYAQEEQEVPT